MKAIIDDQDPLTSGYKKNTLFYSNSGNWIEKVPEHFKTLMSIAPSDYYIAGWWPHNDVLANKVMAISGELMGQPLFVYAGNPTNRQHPCPLLPLGNQCDLWQQVGKLDGLRSS